MLPYMEGNFGNPSSIHHVGRAARHGLDDARQRIATVFRCQPSEIVFTSGGTESNNLALFGATRLLRERGRHIVASSIEHPAVLESLRYLEQKEGHSVTLVPVDSSGRVSVESVHSALRPDTILVSVMAANNETGAIQPVAEIGDLCRAKGILFHTDAVQAFGKLPFAGIDQFNADLVSFCSHKCHGPKGAGLLFVRAPLPLTPLLFGGGHEQDKRAGTENLPSIVGTATVVDRFLSPPVFPSSELFLLTSRLIAALKTLPGITLVSPGVRLANTVSFTVAGCDSLSLLAALDMTGVCASSGSACSSGSLLPSHVLTAMGFPPALANSFIRFSLGRASSVEEVDFISALLPSLIDRIRQCQ
jgi:cysteine desulfurase